MKIEVEAVYENGSLKLDHPLPLQERQRVRLVVQDDALVARRSYGIIGWKGDADIIQRAAMEPEAGLLESP